MWNIKFDHFIEFYTSIYGCNLPVTISDFQLCFHYKPVTKYAIAAITTKRLV